MCWASDSSGTVRMPIIICHGASLTVIVPQVIDHEVVAIDVAPLHGRRPLLLGDNRERR